MRARILTSMLKRVDIGVFQEIQFFVKGDRSGGIRRYDMKVGGVGYAPSNPAIKSYEQRLETARFRILSGSARIPTS